MYQDFSLHVHQYKALFSGLVLRPARIGPHSFGLAGNYRPNLARFLLNTKG